MKTGRRLRKQIPDRKSKSLFMKFKNVFANSDFDLDLKIGFTKCHVWSVLLYGK